jgi:hypothetical protein
LFRAFRRAHANVERGGEHARVPQQPGDVPSPGERRRAVAPVLAGILVAFRRTGRTPAVHAAAAVRHRRRPAGITTPRARAAARTAQHGQPLHGVVSRLCVATPTGAIGELRCMGLFRDSCPAGHLRRSHHSALLPEHPVQGAAGYV